MTKIVIQYFEDCPHSDEMIKNIRKVIKYIYTQIEFVTIPVDTSEKAEKYKFRGSPTVMTKELIWKDYLYRLLVTWHAVTIAMEFLLLNQLLIQLKNKGN